jgi:anaphase-promoting complex subunit 6
MSSTKTPTNSNKYNNNNNFDNKICEKISSSPKLSSVIKNMKNLITKNISLHLYRNALFYAEKCLVISLTHDINSISDNIYMLAKCLFLNKEYSRCVNLIQKYNVIYYNINFLILYGQALFNCDDYDGVILYLEKEAISFESQSIDDENNSIKSMHSIRHLLIGKAYEMKENKQPAIRNYLLALKNDLENIEAFDILINHQLLNTSEKQQLLNTLNFNQNNCWLYDYYKSKINDNIFMTYKSDVEIDLGINKIINEINSENNSKFKRENNMEDINYNNISTINIMDVLYKNNDQSLMLMEAEKMFMARDYTNTYKKLKKINEDDFYNLELIPMLCSSMIELNKIVDLYSLAYKLGNNCNDKFIPWYAVGCYYYAIKKYEISRKYFLKCNQLNKNFPEGWVALGNSYAGEDESDQALNAYRTCLRLFPGCHYSNLYIGMEFVRTNNLKTALIAFQNALQLSQNDPLIYNEIGVVYYKQQIYEEAQNYFIKGIKMCSEDDVSSAYQTLMINLGHTYRKLKKLKEALEVYMKLYYIDSKNVDVLNGIGFVLSLIGKYNYALDYFHQANFIQSNDSFSITMINKCINEINY